MEKVKVKPEPEGFQKENKEHVDEQTTGITKEEVHQLKQKVKYTKEQVEERLKSEIFRSQKTISKDEFLKTLEEFFHLNSEADALLLQRMYQLTDRNKDSFVDMEEYTTILSLLYADTSDEKLNFIFNSFDLNGDGKISKDEFRNIVKTLWENDLCRHLFDFAIDERRIEGVDVFVESFFKEADKNKDDFISFDEYKENAKKYSHAVTDHKLKILPNQTGGHVSNFRKLPGGKIMKATNLIEFQFYESLKDYPELIPYAPTYFGPDNTDNRNWIIIADLTQNMNKPCIMDIKMGVTSAGEDADAGKRESMEKKDMESTTHNMGVRITGMKVYDLKKKEYTQFTKSWGRKVTEATFGESLTCYFNTGNKIRYDIVRKLIQKLKIFQEWMNNQHTFRFFSSSLLFVYDAEPNVSAVSENTDTNDKSWKPDDVYYSLIDFAHAFRIKDNGKDDGYIFGLNNLMKQLESILSKEK